VLLMLPTAHRWKLQTAHHDHEGLTAQPLYLSDWRSPSPCSLFSKTAMLHLFIAFSNAMSLQVGDSNESAREGSPAEIVDGA
jgi:hypothetical protein